MLKINPNGNTAYNYHQFQLIVIIQLIKINPKVIDIEALLYIYLNKINKIKKFLNKYLLYSFSSAGCIVSILAYTKG